MPSSKFIFLYAAVVLALLTSNAAFHLIRYRAESPPSCHLRDFHQTAPSSSASDSRCSGRSRTDCCGGVKRAMRHRLVSTARPAIEPLSSMSEFEAAGAAAGVVVVVDFQKSQCKPCMRIAPQFSAMSDAYAASGAPVRFYKVDADTCSEALAMMRTLQIRSVPTFYVFSDGQQVDIICGAHIDDLEDLVKQEVEKLNGCDAAPTKVL